MHDAQKVSVKRNVIIRLEDKAIEILDKLAQERGITRSDLIRRIIWDFLERKGLYRE